MKIETTAVHAGDRKKPPEHVSSTTPILIGGIIRWAVDRWIRRTKYATHNLTEDQLVAEGDKSPGVLMASGYIDGGAIA